MSQPFPTPKQAIDAALHATEFLVGPKYDPMYALTIIEPFSSCEHFADAEEEQTRRVRSIVCAVVADCHRELGDFKTAADWYRTASQHWKIGGFPAYYAEVVVAHELVEHYETVLDCLKANRADWHSRPLCVRLDFNVRSLWWIYPSMWFHRLKERKTLRRLEALVQQQRKSN